MDLVYIRLLRNDWQRLRNRIPPDSRIRHLFGPTRSVDHDTGLVSIDCSKEEAERLLEAARQYCRQAIPAIQKSITESDNSRSAN
jgi:hypothetical protein